MKNRWKAPNELTFIDGIGRGGERKEFGTFVLATNYNVRFGA